MNRIFLPADSIAIAKGADQVADTFNRACAARDLCVEIVRTGSRGMAWLEPLVEIETSGGRVGFGPVRTSDVAALLDADILSGGDHPLAIGKIADQA